MRRRMQSRRGTTAVEFALTFPILAIILLTSIEFGWYFSQQAMVQAAVVDAARFGSNQENIFDAEDAAEGAAVTLLVDMGFSCSTVTECNIVATGTNAGFVPSITVTADVPYEQLTGVLPSGAVGHVINVPNDLPAKAVMPIVGPS